MVALIIGIFVVIVVVQILRWFANADPKAVKKSINWGGLTLILAVILFLVVTGRINAALAGLVALIGWVGRIAGMYQMIRQIFGLGSRAGQAGGSAQGGGASGPQTAMSAEEAYRLLGLSPGATEDDIKAAYRRLMGQVHPDKGGSDYLAAKINQAKDVLMKGRGNA
jgi:DnaJ family protein C protein 19